MAAEALLVASFVLPMLFVMLLQLCHGAGREEEENVAADQRAAPPVSASPVVLVQSRPAAAPAPAVKLGYFPYSALGSRRASEKLVCAICLEVFVDKDMCSEVPACRHLFHRDCIDVWMKTKNTCPLCRLDIVTGARRPSVPNDIV